MQIIRNFIGRADNADHPQKKNRVEMVGPFSVRDGEDNYQHLIRPASSSQSILLVAV